MRIVELRSASEIGDERTNGRALDVKLDPNEAVRQHYRGCIGTRKAGGVARHERALSKTGGGRYGGEDNRYYADHGQTEHVRSGSGDVVLLLVQPGGRMYVQTMMMDVCDARALHRRVARFWLMR